MTLPQIDHGRAVLRFVPVDGLRAWLAWIVVAGHLAQQAFPGGYLFEALDVGGQAVNCFIIISGFVITHLLVERPTSYVAYLIPRFMRLFPAFAVCCIAGAAAYTIAHTWADPVWFQSIHGRDWRTMQQFWPQHGVAHLLMLHGAVPDPILPRSQYAFVPPGWSVSLEWQFYLVAPLAVWLCRDRSRSWILIAAVIAATAAYHYELKNFWERPSFLPGAAKFFLIGIASRMAAPLLAGHVHQVAAVGIGLSFSALWIGSPALGLWLMVYSFMLRHDHDGGRIERTYINVLRLALESRPILYLADRSYSTYLLHWPVLMLVATAATYHGVSPGSPLAAVLLTAIPLVALLQEPLYRLVEIPARKSGKLWVQRLGARPITENPREALSQVSGKSA